MRKLIEVNNMETKNVSKFNDGSLEFEPGIIVCACHDHSHSIIYNKFEDINKNGEKTREVYLDYHFLPCDGFFKRVKKALKFIFKKNDIELFDELIINEKNVSGLEDIVNFIKQK